MTCVTLLSTTAASAPGYVARIVNEGGAISGYCSTGSARSAMTPASRMLSAITQANTGRSMKKRGVIASRWGLRVRGLLRRSRLFGRDGHFLSRTDLLEAINYDTFPGLESSEHSP